MWMARPLVALCRSNDMVVVRTEMMLYMRSIVGNNCPLGIVLLNILLPVLG